MVMHAWGFLVCVRCLNECIWVDVKECIQMRGLGSWNSWIPLDSENPRPSRQHPNIAAVSKHRNLIMIRIQMFVCLLLFLFVIAACRLYGFADANEWGGLDYAKPPIVALIWACLSAKCRLTCQFKMDASRIGCSATTSCQRLFPANFDRRNVSLMLNSEWPHVGCSLYQMSAHHLLSAFVLFVSGSPTCSDSFLSSKRNILASLHAQRCQV